jgi:hypothetical protein
MKIYPGDIDSVVEQYKELSDVCTFAYEDDPLYGQNIGIALVLKKISNEILKELYNFMIGPENTSPNTKCRNVGT